MCGKLLKAFSHFHWLLQWLIFSILALALYAPILGNNFVNDDFLVLKKVCLDQQLNTKGFFRPLSDISLYANYLLSGFNAMPYYLTNVLLHALNACILFVFCARWHWTDSEIARLKMAGIAALLFLTYPFHNESVVWVLGRASLIAATFTFLALVIITTNWRERWKLLASAICFFIATAGYESVFVFPGILFCWLLVQKAAVKKIVVWMGAMALALLAHIIVRIQVSGSVMGEYGSNVVGGEEDSKLANVLKVAGRLLAPPAKDPAVFIGSSIILYLLLFWGIWLFRKKFSADENRRRQFLGCLAMLLLAVLLPFVVGVSTNSSESDRFLYFPSFFLCLALGFLLVNVLGTGKWLAWITGGILIYQVIFLQINNQNWRNASDAVGGILKIVKEQEHGGKLYIVNLPDEWNGAYIFRVGFQDALTINRLDDRNVVVVNRSTRRELERLPTVSPQPTGKNLFIPPAVVVQRNNDSSGGSQNKYRSIFVSGSDRVVYWNRKRWVVLQ